MRYAIVSDIHANWQAWSAVRDDIFRRDADTMICLGDIVGYGPSPVRVFADLMEHCENVVLGNHDAAAAGKLDLDMFNDQARRSTEWTAAQFGPEDLERLGSAPLTLEAEDILFVHAETPSPEEFGYVETKEDASACFAATDARFIFIGHTHIPLVFALRPDGTISVTKEPLTRAEPGTRYLVNVGSVGDPGDGSVLASYCVFDSETGEIHLNKVAFDVSAFRAELDRVPKLTLSWFLQKHEADAARPVHDQVVAAGKVARARIRVPSSRGRIQVHAGAMSPRAEGARRTAKKPEPAKTAKGVRAVVLGASIGVLALGVLAGRHFAGKRDVPAQVSRSAPPKVAPPPPPAAAAPVAQKTAPPTPRARVDVPPVVESRVPAPAGRDALAQIKEASEYRLVYDLDLAKLAATIPYVVDHSASVPRFDRVAYLMELTKAGEPARFLWVSMDAFTTEAAKLGVPTVQSGVKFQQAVSNITVVSDQAGIVTGERIGPGHLEFWSTNYDKKNQASVPGASDAAFDFGDSASGTDAGYGSMQVHNPSAKQTLFAVNHWGSGGAKADLGIGNSDVNARRARSFDWTFAENGASYSAKRLRVFVRPAR